MRNNRLVIILFFLCTSLAYSSEIVLGTGYSWVRTNLTGQNDVPLYKGSGISADLDFILPFDQNNAISIFGVYLQTNQENTANDLVIEKLKIHYTGAGLRLYLDKVYTSISMGKIKFEDTITGAVSKKISADALGFELGLGLRFRLTSFIGLTCSIFGLHSSLTPSEGDGFYADYDVWQFRGSLGLTFVLPSSPTEEFW